MILLTATVEDDISAVAFLSISHEKLESNGYISRISHELNQNWCITGPQG